MAKNDVVLLDGIIEDRLEAQLPSDQRDEVFEYFAFEQLLKDFDPSREEIENGWVDGRNDGGIDGFFTTINGYILQDPSAFTWPKKNAEIDVVVITCKHHETFQQAPLNALLITVGEILDLSADETSLKSGYNNDLLDARRILLASYRHLSSVRPRLNFRFYYVSRGDSTLVADNVASRGGQIVEIVRTLFSDCQASVSFIGAAELIDVYRKNKSFSLDLHATELMTSGPGNYVGIVKLEDYYNFIIDEKGSLRRYLFDSNVRDYLGENTVNSDIADSLADDQGPEFWWLNNGVTLLATGATSAGKILTLHGIQIVNGLQTTESIFRHFQRGSVASRNRGLLVKAVVSIDSVVRDQIIRATNNQSLVETASLHATDKLQRDIEEILERHDWYYERRKNYYRNIGKPESKFVTPLYIAAGYIALIMKNPGIAARLKSRFMRSQDSYEKVFSPATPLHAWVVITEVLKRAEQALSRIRSTRMHETERFMRSWRNLVAFLAVSQVFGSFAFSAAELVDLDLDKLSENLFDEMWQLIEGQRATFIRQRDSTKGALVKACCLRLEVQSGVVGIDKVGKESLDRSSAQSTSGSDLSRPVELTERFIESVNQALPEQPWVLNTHSDLKKSLKCSRRKLAAAINELVARATIQLHDSTVLIPEKNYVIHPDSAGSKADAAK